MSLAVEEEVGSQQGETRVRSFDPDRVRPLPDQPRKRFTGIRELADSIRAIGQTAAGIVTLVDDDPQYEAQLVDGERRLRACKVAGVKFRAEIAEIPQGQSMEFQQFCRSLASNFHREPHNVIEIAHAMARLEKAGMTIEESGKLCGKSGGWVVQHKSLLRLHPDVQKLLVPDDTPDRDVEQEFDVDSDPDDGSSDSQGTGQRKLTFSLALLLVSIHPDRQLPLARQIMSEKMSLTAARRLIYRELHSVPSNTRRKRSPGELIDALLSLVQTSEDRFGVYTDMSGVEFNAMIDSQPPEMRKKVADALDQFAENVGDISEVIRKRLSVPQVTRPGQFARGNCRN